MPHHFDLRKHYIYEHNLLLGVAAQTVSAVSDTSQGGMCHGHTEALQPHMLSSLVIAQCLYVHITYLHAKYQILLKGSYQLGHGSLVAYPYS